MTRRRENSNSKALILKDSSVKKEKKKKERQIDRDRKTDKRERCAALTSDRLVGREGKQLGQV